MTFLSYLFRLTAILLLAIAGFAPRYSVAATKDLPDLTVSLTQVRAKLEVGGDLLVPGDLEPIKVPMSVAANFDYVERRIDDGTQPEHRRSLRYYRAAGGAIKIGKQASEATLADGHRLIRAALTGSETALAAARGHLSRDELDLIDVPGNTLLLDLLLTKSKLKQGSNWKPNELALAKLLCIDSIRQSHVEARITSMNGEVGEALFDGKITGEVADAATEIELKGKLHFDVRLQRPFSLVMLIKEQRKPGTAGPGLDVTARLQLQIEPINEFAPLGDAALAGIELAGDGNPASLEHRSGAGGFQLLYDPRWRITREESDRLAMRLIDRGNLVAQCNISVLSAEKSTESISLESFQKEVQQSLGKNFGAFERAAERKHPAGYRLLHAAAHGAVSDLPIVWHYYMLIDEHGRRAALSFTMEGRMLDRFGDADQLILDGFRFNQTAQAATGQQTKR